VPGTASISGVISGLDTDEIVAKLMELERLPIVRLQAKRTTLNTRLAAWQEANTRVLALKTKADALAGANTFGAKTVTSSDDTILTGTATYQATAGTYFLKVTALARTHQLTTQGYADTTSTRVGTGTISIQVGSAAAEVITIDDTNNTLEGVRKAINNAGAGVTATILNDGSGSAPYRLLVTSNTGGTAGEVTITPSLTGGTTPTFSTLQAAQDASITLGEGDGAITVTKGTNTITNLIPGVTLNLKDSDAGQVLTLTISPNTDSMKQAIRNFVSQYNNLVDFINQQFAYNTATNSGGTLFGDSSLQIIQSDVYNKVFSPVTGIDQTIIALSQIGITSTTSDDRLTIDEDALDEALAGGVDTIKRLFAAVGEATSASISYVSGTDKTLASGTDGYAIQITAVATQARITSGAAQTENLAQDEQLTINGVTIQLTSGMTAAQVITRINEYTSQTGISASRTGGNGEGSGDYITLTRTAYGSAGTISAVSTVSNGGGTPVSNTSGLGNVQVTETSYTGETGTGTGAAGTDVAGTINGEAATGVGQILTGNEGNDNTEGLKIRVTATTTGSHGTIVFSKGTAALLADYLDFITESDTGSIDTAQSGIETEIEDIDEQIAYLEERVAAKQEALLRQFNAMESALNRLQTQGTFLTGQLAQALKGWQ
jgi:flagellar hook-associated protein 2